MRAKSAVAAAASENVKNFKIYRWDPNEKVGTGACSFISVPVVGCLLLVARREYLYCAGPELQSDSRDCCCVVILEMH